MEDDIDIEEHDLMDNPRIKSIFPDLSCVKIEIPDEEEIEEEYGDPTLESQQPEMVYQYEYRFETTTEDVPEPSYEDSDDDDDGAYFYGNQIILGSKPTIDPEALYVEALNSQPVVYLENWEDKLKNSPCFCNTCQILFSTVNALDAHKMVSHSYLVALDTSQKNTARKSTVTSKFCNHCSKTFPDDTSLIKHLYELLPLNNFTKVKEEAPESTKYTCDESGQTFPTYNAGRWHKMTHPAKKGDSNSVVKTNPKKIRFKPTEVKIEPVEVKLEQHDDMDTVKTPVVRKIPKKYKSRVPGSLKRDGKFFVTSLVPKNSIFQCSICSIGFMSCFSALQHSKSCAKTLDHIKCDICKRKIRTKDEKIHETQHNFSDKLKIYTVHKNIYDKVLCKCPKCLACFDELCFWAHYKNCTNSSSSYCPDCDINIGTVRYNCHRQKHLDKKLTKKDFIVIEFHDQIQSADKKEQEKAKKMKFKEKFLKYKVEIPKINSVNEYPDGITLYYCEFCGCCQYILSHKGHINGECKNKIPKRFCDKCGLSFSAKSMERHVKLHEKRTFTAKDVKIVSLRTGKTIDPPMSEFFKCLKCKNHFLFRKQVHRHNCKTEKYIVCKICSKKYNLQAYKVHKICHSYDKELIPELLKKYNSINNMWNVVYMCGKCNLVSMTYDSAVNHAQNHINKINVTSQNNCHVCDFIIGDKDLKKHKKLHLNNGSINRNSFRVLIFNFEDLLNDNWMEIFTNLPNKHRQQILSKSIYRYTRNVKLNTIVKAPTDDIKYFCMNCKNFVEGNDIAAHLQANCEITHKYTCNVCHVTLNSLKQFVAHEGSHEKIQKRRKFVTFNNVSDKEFNQKLISIANTNKKGKKKILKHTKSKLREILMEGVKKKYKIYKCAKCLACVSLEASMRRHTCISDDNKKFCPICEQYFSRKKIAVHMQAHKNKPNVNKDTLNVVYFNGEKTTQNPPKSPSKISPIKSVAKIFKCDCGLHFTSMKTVLKHLDVCGPGLKVFGEKCSKCHLLFPTEVLVTHLCNHHSKAKKIVIEKFSKVPLFKCASCTLLFTNTEKYHSHTEKNCDVKNGKNCEHCHLHFDKSCFSTHKCSVKDDVTYITKINVMKKTAKFYNVYRCELCDLSYLTYNSYKYHVFDVKHKISIQLATCDYCGLKFTHYSWQKHVKIHTRNNDMYRIKVIDPVSGSSFMKTGTNIKIEGPADDTDDIKPVRSSPRKRKRDSIKTETDTVKKVKTEHFTDDLSKNKVKIKIEVVPTDSNEENGSDNVNDTLMSDPNSDHTLSISFIDKSLDTDKLDSSDATDIKNETLTDKKDEISSKLKARIMVHKYDKRLYRCKYCNQHFMKDSSFDYHVKANNHKDAPENYKCNICELDFSRYTLPRHKYVHHQRMSLNKEDFLILTESTYSKELYEKIDNNASKRETANEISKANTVVSKVDKSKDVSKITDDDNTINKTNTQSSAVTDIFNDSQEVFHSLSKIINSYSENDDDKINKVTTENSQSIIETCKTKDDTETISDCTDNANKMADNPEMTDDAPKDKEDSNDYIKIASEITDRLCKLCETASEVTDNVKSVEDPSNTADEPNKITKFISELGHRSSGDVTSITNDAKIRNLSEICESSSEITEDSNEVTKTTSEISNSTDNASQINEDTRITSLSDSYESSSVTDDSNEVKEIISKIAELGGTAEVISDLSNESSEATDITDNSDDNNINEISLSVSDIDISTENVDNENETENICYFKCSDCNVCFLTQNTCHQHTVKHVVLDPKTYIQCKICNFQFPIDSLKEHMDIHHCTDFRLENLMIQEYKALGDGLQPKIDTYRALDKVQSRLISTTTDVGVV